LRAANAHDDPDITFTFNNDGTFNLCDEGFYGAGEELYVTFDSWALDVTPTPPTVGHVFVSPALYRIDPDTGHATYVAETDLKLLSIFEVGETMHAFRGVVTGFDHTINFPSGHSELVRLDLRTGKTARAIGKDLPLLSQSMKRS
jgi:hypothetical protein